MARSDTVDTLTGCNHKQLHRAQCAALARLWRHQLDGLVDAAHPLYVYCQRIQKNTGQGMPRDLGNAGVFVVGFGRAIAFGFVHTPGPNNQDTLCTQMNGGRNGRRLAHGAIAKIM